MPIINLSPEGGGSLETGRFHTADDAVFQLAKVIEGWPNVLTADQLHTISPNALANMRAIVFLSLHQGFQVADPKAVIDYLAYDMAPQSIGQIQRQRADSDRTTDIIIPIGCRGGAIIEIVINAAFGVGWRVRNCFGDSPQLHRVRDQDNSVAPTAFKAGEYYLDPDVLAQARDGNINRMVDLLNELLTKILRHPDLQINTSQWWMDGPLSDNRTCALEISLVEGRSSITVRLHLGKEQGLKTVEVSGNVNPNFNTPWFQGLAEKAKEIGQLIRGFYQLT